MSKRQIEPIHPGEILLEEFLGPMGISQYRLAKEISVDPRRINEIVLGKRGVTADTALRLSRYFGMTERFWLNLQSRYDLELEKDRLGVRLFDEVEVFALSDSGPLTPRELEILLLLSRGLSNREIGERLHLAEETVSHYMDNILAKLDAESPAQAADLAVKMKLGLEGET